jgi:hypothetical protein
MAMHDSYNIEPFYFSLSIGWTPSRFQESLDKEKKSDRELLPMF